MRPSSPTTTQTVKLSKPSTDLFLQGLLSPSSHADSTNSPHPSFTPVSPSLRPLHPGSTVHSTHQMHLWLFMSSWTSSYILHVTSRKNYHRSSTACTTSTSSLCAPSVQLCPQKGTSYSKSQPSWKRWYPHSLQRSANLSYSEMRLRFSQGQMYAASPRPSPTSKHWSPPMNRSRS
ncbi:hypothetical protein OF83DRAFT_660723 [Amylostereum chailletii]|nr:hypothetical protein OF83DRAFT_660723 [Amylostereum chailletii]